MREDTEVDLHQNDALKVGLSLIGNVLRYIGFYLNLFKKTLYRVQ